jgi:hypothetical protein
VHPSTLSRLQTFREQVLLPTLKDIEAGLEGPGQQLYALQQKAIDFSK